MALSINSETISMSFNFVSVADVQNIKHLHTIPPNKRNPVLSIIALY